MKTVNAILGAIISFFLLLGITFKTMHWPGAGVLIVLSASLLSLYMIPVAIGNILNYKKKTFFAICNGIGAFGGMILSVGLLFKIMHWPGSGVMMIFGMFFSIIVILFFMVLFIVSKEPIKLSPGTFYVTICFGILIYGVSVGGSSRMALTGIINSANIAEENVKTMAYEIDVHSAVYQHASLLHKEVGELYYYIENLKEKLYEEVEGIPSEVADTISLNNIYAVDNYDIPTHLLGIADPGNPAKVPGMEEYSATTLKEKIEKFNAILNEIDPKMEKLNTQDNSYNGQLDAWETSTFYHYPLAQVILTLNLIELEAFAKSNYLIVWNQPKISEQKSENEAKEK